MNPFIFYNSRRYEKRRDHEDDHIHPLFDQFSSAIKDPNSKLSNILRIQSDKGNSSHIYGEIDSCKILAKLLNAEFSGKLSFVCDKDNILKISTLS